MGFKDDSAEIVFSASLDRWICFSDLWDKNKCNLILNHEAEIADASIISNDIVASIAEK